MVWPLTKRAFMPIMLATTMLGASSALALETPRSGDKDERIRVVNYDPDQIVKIVGRERASTQVMFAETEQIVNIGLGDSVAWEVAPAQNILFLKPREHHPVTNLQVVTMRADGRRRVYQFELTATAGKIENRDVFLAVRFRYPSDDAELARQKRDADVARSEGRRIDDALNLSQAVGARNFAFSAQGTRSLEPDSIYDDGKVTVMRFNGNRPIPAIYMVRDDADESLVPNTVRDSGRVVVVQATARQFRLREGRNVLCITNEHYDPAGINTGTGTSSVAVERVLTSKVEGAPK